MGETQLVTKYATLSDPKAMPPPPARAAACQYAFRREGLSSWCPKNAQSPSTQYASILRQPKDALPGRRACAARAAFVWTGTHRVAV